MAIRVRELYSGDQEMLYRKMSSTSRRKSTATVMTMALAVAGTGMWGEARAHDGTDHDALGLVEFDTSCGEEAQAKFERGLLLLHHMMYTPSAEAFQEASNAQPDCAMAQWGLAMSSFHPLWPGGPTELEVARGNAAAARLRVMTPQTPREAAYIDAVLAFFDGDETPYPQRLSAWAASQRTVDEQFPDDIEAAAFDALAQMTVASRASDATREIADAGARLEALYVEMPDHPGIIHYAIHAYDHPALAEKGLRFAQDYDRIAPEVAHALHMPSHIFVRLGHWQEAAEWNDRSAAAALKHSTGDVVSNHYPHAMDYGIYARLQLGESQKAEEMLEEFLSTENIEDAFGSAYALASAPARIPLEQENWARAAALPTDIDAGITWDRFPQTVGIRWFAKGIGAARAGDRETAATALSELSVLRETLVARDLGYWVTLLDAQSTAVEAWLAYADGDEANAVATMREAADLEDSVGKSPVTPSAVLPVRELLGDLLMETGDAAGALEAYEAALRISPNRRRSVVGAEAARAAQGQ